MTTRRSPFPPIADYAFLSDCETMRLVAPSGAVEWMCLPRPGLAERVRRDARPRRRRLPARPADVTVPAARRYLPGTMVLETTWRRAPAGSIVRDALLHRALAPRRRALQHPPPLAHRLRRRPRAAADGQVRERRRSSSSLDCEPVFDYGRRAREWEYAGEGYNEARGARATTWSPLRLRHRPAPGLRGPRAQRAHTHAARATPRSSRSPGPSTAAATTTTRPTTGWSAPPTTGASGSTTASSPTTPGAATCSAAR